MNLKGLKHGHLRVWDLPIKCIAKQVLDEYLEIFISKMAQVLKELMSQGKVLSDFELLCLVEGCPRIWIDETTSRMLLQEFLPQLEGLICQCNDLDLILEVRDVAHCHAILLRVDILKSVDDECAECLQQRRSSRQ